MKFEISKNLSSRNFVTMATGITLFYLCDDYVIPFINFRSCHLQWIYYELQWPALQLARLTQWIKHCDRLVAKVRVRFPPGQVLFQQNLTVGKAQIYFHLKEREPGSYDKTLTSATSTPPPPNPKHTHMVRNLLSLLVASFIACWRLSPVFFLRSLSRCMTTLKTAA